ncbi:MAG: adenylyltransferase/cytidyltransferase family protein [Chitinophagaceae bacterium]|jgi:D-beta-D-heptose 7-phosphate kinase/D-beta-D-heptose 1-phosphate adenosyltransferase|nr:adenylyltransferase/cytidyltransferase family protein [Chitinophagaceae bacterium]
MKTIFFHSTIIYIPYCPQIEQMRNINYAEKKIFDLSSLKREIEGWRLKSKTIAFTNGVFDIVHKGHIASLSQAAAEADCLIVAINSDRSVKRLKGENRPIYPEQVRAMMLASLLITDAIVIFEEDTPLHVINTLLPDVLVKGGDYTLEQIVGAKEVTANGGRVVINPIIEGFSTTKIIENLEMLKQ